MNSPKIVAASHTRSGTSATVVAARRLPCLVRKEAQINDGGRDADRTRHQEGRAPAQPLDQGGSHAGGKRRAEIAADAVEGERAAARRRLLDQHRHADGMIDRRKHAERGQRNRQDDEVGREARRHQRKPAAQIEQRHHVAPAPAVGEPAGRQREDAEGDKGRGAERDQLGVAASVNELEPDHHGRKDQHHIVVERMRPIDEADGNLGLFASLIAGCDMGPCALAARRRDCGMARLQAVDPFPDRGADFRPSRTQRPLSKDRT